MDNQLAASGYADLADLITSTPIFSTFAASRALLLQTATSCFPLVPCWAARSGKVRLYSQASQLSVSIANIPLGPNLVPYVKPITHTFNHQNAEQASKTNAIGNSTANMIQIALLSPEHFLLPRTPLRSAPRSAPQPFCPTLLVCALLFTTERLTRMS